MLDKAGREQLTRHLNHTGFGDGQGATRAAGLVILEAVQRFLDAGETMQIVTPGCSEIRKRVD